MQDKKCCGVVERVTSDARARRAAKPQPWVSRKLVVALTFGIIIYAAYVYIGRFVVPMLQGKADAGGSRGVGIALLIIFVLLWLWVVWAYMRVVVTSPGLAPQHVPRTETHPGYSDFPSVVEPALAHVRGRSYEEMSEIQPTESTAVTAPRRVIRKARKPPRLPTAREKAEMAKAAYISRIPPSVPVLRPEHRYCNKCKIVKPYRTHHCRACGTCILRYDHHCPWIGQCVGARNYKFFMNFNLAAGVLALFTFATLLAFIVHNSATMNLDAQEIVVIVLAGMIALFTFSMLFSHTRLILRGQTTLESMQSQMMSEREDATLAQVFKCWEVGAKHRTRRRWDEEWGVPKTEGNIWWLGSGRREWEDVMGRNWLGWILPIGHSLSDGLQYPVNPRFDVEGRLRPRYYWPNEV
ncbi:zf-DHHC-domain-containing protein [Fistulina hepatica ATCC 64428]|uniref:Palmitoyltransferase n=1 Tax=Fistulina hepatica ATCC 64428 TaxID=1128425 RepID=A0A0D7AD18_9AGAR|nr:zf-DHHC-domain-containing protein [Fistulina hepatica ATCC 64428]